MTEEQRQGVMSAESFQGLQRGRTVDDEEEEDDALCAVGFEPPRKRASVEGAGADGPGSTASLKDFAQRVRQKVEELGETTSKAVAQALIADIRGACTAAEAAKVNEQNINRRVYDIVNVMAAIGMVEKQNKTIVWRGVLTQDRRDVVRTLGQEKHRLQDEVAKRKRQAEELRRTLDAYQIAIQIAAGVPVPESAVRDKVVPGDAVLGEAVSGEAVPGEKLPLPFLFLVSEGDVKQEFEDPNPRRALLNFTQQFSIFSDADALQRMAAENHGRRVFNLSDAYAYPIQSKMDEENPPVPLRSLFPSSSPEPFDPLSGIT